MSLSDADPAVPYGAMERLLHRVAFANLEMQKSLGRVENRLYAGELDAEAARRPVFVASLPRAGTTVLLQALAGLPDFASATYRHMPFTLAPLLWRRFAGGFGAATTRGERAHGDGVEVDLDSPEAFEETLWLAFWPEHYGPAAIAPWAEAEEADGFRDFLAAHMAKIVRLAGSPARRYLSKNNANIARLGLLGRLFPEATVVVPVRDPFAQTASLMRQHRRFARLHARDPFARAYMEGLGHFEFGAALKPIAFAGTRALDPAEAERPDFWLAYWCDAYAHVLATAGPGVAFVDHDALSADPAPHLAALAGAIGLDDTAPLTAAARHFRRGPTVFPPVEASSTLVARARNVYAALLHRCLAPKPAAAPAKLAPAH